MNNELYKQVPMFSEPSARELTAPLARPAPSRCGQCTALREGEEEGGEDEERGRGASSVQWDSYHDPPPIYPSLPC
jgi:hypothetical protein